MSRVSKNGKVKAFTLGFMFLCFSTVFLSGPGHTDQVLWKVKVPVLLKGMSSDAEYVVIHWQLYKGLSQELAEDQLFFPLEADAQGNFSDLFTIEIYESDLPDPTLADNIFISLELSQDGMIAYKPNTPGKDWTKQKPGTNLVKIVTVVNLQEDPQKGPWTA